MASEIEMNEVEQFTKGTIFKWFTKCIELFDIQANVDLSYETLIDGVLIHRLFCQTDIQVIDNAITQPLNQIQRYLNLRKIMENIRHFLEVNQKISILLEPNLLSLTKLPKLNVCEMENLLYLLFVCVVNSSKKNTFIDVFHKLDLDHQTKKECIKEMLMTLEFILSADVLMDLNSSEKNELHILDNIRKIEKELDDYRKIDQSETAFIVANSQVAVSQESPTYRTKNDQYSQQEQESFQSFKLNEIQNQLQDALKNLKTCQQNCKQLEKEKAALESSKSEVEERFNVYQSKTKQMQDNLKKRIALREEELSDVDKMVNLDDELPNTTKMTMQKILITSQCLQKIMESLERNQETNNKDDFNEERKNLSNILEILHKYVENLTSKSCDQPETDHKTQLELQRLSSENENLLAELKVARTAIMNIRKRAYDFKFKRKLQSNLATENYVEPEANVETKPQGVLVQFFEELMKKSPNCRSIEVNQYNEAKSRDQELLDELRQKVDQLQEDNNRYRLFYRITSRDENLQLKQRKLEAELTRARDSELKLKQKLQAKDSQIAELTRQLNETINRSNQEINVRWMDDLQHLYDKRQTYNETKTRLSRAKERVEDKIIDLLENKRSADERINRHQREIFKLGDKSKADDIPCRSDYSESDQLAVTTISTDSLSSSLTKLPSLDWDEKSTISDSSFLSSSNRRVSNSLLYNILTASEFGSAEVINDECDRKTVDDKVNNYLKVRNCDFWSTYSSCSDGLNNDHRDSDKDCKLYFINAKPVINETDK